MANSGDWCDIIDELKDDLVALCRRLVLDRAVVVKDTNAAILRIGAKIDEIDDAQAHYENEVKLEEGKEL